MTGLPAGLREALTEAARNVLNDFFGPVAPDDQLLHFLLNTQMIALSPWLAGHDAEVRQQGRNEAASDIEAFAAEIRPSGFLPTSQSRYLFAEGIMHAARIARGGSDLKGQDG